MLEIHDVEILNQKELNVTKKKSKKTQILLYDTGRRCDDFMMMLKYRFNGKYDEMPHYVVSKLGKVYKVFNTDHSSKTFGNPDIDKKQIKIAIENLGWLNKNTITGIYNNWIGDIYRTQPFIKNWRGYFYWDQYTDEQTKSLVTLCKSLSEEHKIPYQTVPSQGYLENVDKFNGIVCKSNFLNIYTDINPSFDFTTFYEDRK
jgi:N-acetyl-anhydromuramyl-L-alanine amidase AmpD